MLRSARHQEFNGRPADESQLILFATHSFQQSLIRWFSTHHIH